MNEGKVTVALGVTCEGKLLGRGVSIFNEDDDQFDPSEGRKYALERLRKAVCKQIHIPAYKRADREVRVRQNSVLRKLAENNLPFTEKSVTYPQPTPFETFFIRSVLDGTLDYSDRRWDQAAAWEEIEKSLPAPVPKALAIAEA